jgi:hypothetical protein
MCFGVQETSRWARRFVEERRTSGLLRWDTSAGGQEREEMAELEGLTQEVLLELCTNEEAFFRETELTRNGRLGAMKAPQDMATESAPVRRLPSGYRLVLGTTGGYYRMLHAARCWRRCRDGADNVWR